MSRGSSSPRTPRAAEILRERRDLTPLYSGLHYVIVGTVDAVSIAVNTRRQIRNIVGTLVLEPLGIADVHRVLQARYAHLRANAARPASPSVDDDAVEVRYDFLRGVDLTSSDLSRNSEDRTVTFVIVPTPDRTCPFTRNAP